MLKLLKGLVLSRRLLKKLERSGLEAGAEAVVIGLEVTCALIATLKAICREIAHSLKKAVIVLIVARTVI